MHLEKREDRGKIKFYLAHSYIDDSKVRKFRKYLGQNLPKEKLKERRQIEENPS